MLSDSDKQFAGQEGTTYDLRLKPKAGSTYYYTITNTTDIQIETEEKDIENLNKSTVGLLYAINKDSTGNYLFKMTYDKVHLYTKNGDVETEADGANAKFAMNPVEKMLGALQDASLVATITPTGEVKQISGYKELSDRLLSNLNSNDPNARQILQKQLDKIIGEGMVRNNLDQLFKMFPDSAVHLGDKWKINSRQSGDLNLNTYTFYRLNEITDGVAHISSESDIQSNNVPMALMGSSITTNLNGDQKGEYKLEAGTGMLLNGNITSDIKGTIQMRGREIPIKIKINVQIKNTNKG